MARITIPYYFWMLKKSFTHSYSLRWTGQDRMCIIKAHYTAIVKMDNIFVNCDYFSDK